MSASTPTVAPDRSIWVQNMTPSDRIIRPEDFSANRLARVALRQPYVRDLIQLIGPVGTAFCVVERATPNGEDREVRRGVVLVDADTVSPQWVWTRDRADTTTNPRTVPTTVQHPPHGGLANGGVPFSVSTAMRIICWMQCRPLAHPGYYEPRHVLYGVGPYWSIRAVPLRLAHSDFISWVQRRVPVAVVHRVRQLRGSLGPFGQRPTAGRPRTSIRRPRDESTYDSAARLSLLERRLSLVIDRVLRIWADQHEAEIGELLRRLLPQ